jgi:hypothetical protein
VYRKMIVIVIRDPCIWPDSLGSFFGTSIDTDL